ncbi:hypothetical protein O1L44_01175 [Streptomyces noursei]|nr:hypothetical protein [Streptomyces noursei]
MTFPQPPSTAPWSASAPPPSSYAYGTPRAPRLRYRAAARYRLPRGARDFGRLRLRETGDEAGALRRFRQACAALAAEAQITWQGTGQQLAVRLVEDERHHLDAALTRPRWTPRTHSAPWTSRSPVVPVGGLRLPPRRPRPPGPAAPARPGGHRAPGPRPVARRLPRGPGERPAAAEPLLARAWQAAVMHADADGLARITHAHAVLALYREDTATAVACLEEAARHSSRDPWFGPGPAHSWALLAIALAPLDAVRARNAARRAWESRHADSDFWLHSTILYARALIERAHGDPAAALRACRKALVAKKLIGDPLFIVGARTMLAGLRRGIRTAAPVRRTGGEPRWWRGADPDPDHRPFFSRPRTGP